MNNETNLIERTTEKRIEYLEKKGILQKASQTMAAAYLLAQISDRLFFAVQDELLKYGFIHRELKQSWNNMVFHRDKTMKTYERLFINTEEQRNALIYDFDSFFPRICGMLQVEDEAAYFCGIEKANKFLPEASEKSVEIKIRTAKNFADAVTEAARRENLSRQRFLEAIIMRIAALEIQKQASEAQAAPYQTSENE